MQNLKELISPVFDGSSELPARVRISAFQSMPESDYHAHPALGSTGIGKLLKSPAHYQAMLNEPQDATESMLFGRMVHMAILEPMRFHQTVVQKPDGMSFATKEGKAWREENGSKTILPYDQFNACLRIMNSVRNHSLIGPILKEGLAEQSIFWRDLSGAECKARFDWLGDDGTVLDIKTTEDASPEAFKRSIANYGYYRQAAHYSEGFAHSNYSHKPLRFLFVAVEKTAPFAVSVYELDQDAIRTGWLECQMAIRTYQKCTEAGQWPSYSEAIQTIGLPVWTAKELRQ